ncbi:MAG: CgeB family protein [Rhizobiaceae bacterium]
MKMVIFGLTVSSSWGNGHATLWRGLIRALARQGWTIVFFERDVPYYAGARDLHEIENGELILYPDWQDAAPLARHHLADADAAIITSYCPDANAAFELMAEAGRPLRIFYDLDTPVTLSLLRRGEAVPYIGPRGLRDFDLVLSYTGGGALDELRDRLGGRLVKPLFGHADPEAHRPTEPREHYAADLSYIGTYAADRQDALVKLFVTPARARPDARFVIAGAQYPDDFPWSGNIFFVRHLPPEEHPAFYSSGRLTLNITRRAMAEMGWCPSGRLFEAAACGIPVISDWWEGLDAFFEPGSEILVARSSADVIAALDRDDAELQRIAKRARERVLAEHSSAKRAEELQSLFDLAVDGGDDEATLEMEGT